MNRIRKKLASDRGASITFALLLGQWGRFSVTHSCLQKWVTEKRPHWPNRLFNFRSRVLTRLLFYSADSFYFCTFSLYRPHLDGKIKLEKYLYFQTGGEAR